MHPYLEVLKFVREWSLRYSSSDTHAHNVHALIACLQTLERSTAQSPSACARANSQILNRCTAYLSGFGCKAHKNGKDGLLISSAMSAYSINYCMFPWYSNVCLLHIPHCLRDQYMHLMWNRCEIVLKSLWDHCKAHREINVHRYESIVK